MKKLFFLGLLLVSSHLTFGQKSLTLIQADSLLSEVLFTVHNSSQVKDSLAVYQFYIRLDLDTSAKQTILKEVRFSDKEKGALLFPHLKDSLNKHFDFSPFVNRKRPYSTIFIPAILCKSNYNGYKGDFKIDINQAYSESFIEAKRRLLDNICGRYYVMTVGSMVSMYNMIYD